MRIISFFILAFLASSTACKNKKNDTNVTPAMKFDKARWLVEKDRTYPYRNAMLPYLIDSVKLKGIRREDVIDILGQPSRVDSSYLFYTIDKKYLGNTLVILNTKTLVIKLGKDSTVEWRKIHG